MLFRSTQVTWRLSHLMRCLRNSCSLQYREFTIPAVVGGAIRICWSHYCHILHPHFFLSNYHMILSLFSLVITPQALIRLPLSSFFPVSFFLRPFLSPPPSLHPLSRLSPFPSILPPPTHRPTFPLPPHSTPPHTPAPSPQSQNWRFNPSENQECYLIARQSPTQITREAWRAVSVDE